MQHGGLKLLGMENAQNNLMRLKSIEDAVKLLKIILKNDENIKKV